MSLLKAIERLVRAGYPESTAKKIATGELPMSDPNRFARAGEQATDTNRELFHWTNRDFNEFQPSTSGKFGQGVYLSPRPYYGEKYVERGDPRRMSVFGPSNIAKREDINSVEKSVLAAMKEQNVPPMAMGDTFWNMGQGKLKEKGFDALEFGDEVVVFDPARVRDVRAAFDPDNVGKRNIMGGQAALGAGGILGALGLPQDATAADVVFAERPEVSKEGKQEVQQLILDTLMGFMAPQPLGDATMDAYNRNRVR